MPLDPEYPDERLAIYMEDSRAAVLLTQEAHAQRAQQLGGEAASWKVRGAWASILPAWLLLEHRARSTVPPRPPSPRWACVQAVNISEVWVAPGNSEASAHPPAASAAVSPEDTAYIEFTSGSTGRPKGVVIHHRGFAAYCCALRDTLGLPADTCSLLTISVNFDPHLRQTWPHLVSWPAASGVPAGQALPVCWGSQCLTRVQIVHC